MGERKLCYGCMERTEFSGGVCPNCGYYDNAPSDPSFIIPGTKLNNRYIVGVTLSTEKVSLILHMTNPLAVKYICGNICHQTCAIVSAVHL